MIDRDDLHYIRGRHQLGESVWSATSLTGKNRAVTQQVCQSQTFQSVMYRELPILE